MRPDLEAKHDLLGDHNDCSEVVQPQPQQRRHSLRQRATRSPLLVIFVVLTCSLVIGKVLGSLFVCYKSHRGQRNSGDNHDLSLETSSIDSLDPSRTDTYGDAVGLPFDLSHPGMDAVSPHPPLGPTLDKKIQLEAHIMSKCPDARDCLQKLVVPTMEKISEKVDFRLSYIGSIDPDSDDVTCMHGPGECLGNIIQLCAQKVYPDPKLFLGFANCMTSDYSKIPDRTLIEGCAMEHGLDFKKLNHCVSQEGEGTDLLRASMARSQAAHVKTSCTVRLEGKVRCVRDGGKWYDCPGGSEVTDLVKEIEKLYDDRNPKE